MSKVSMKMYDFREYMSSTKSNPAIGEPAVNGVDAAMHDENPLVWIKFPKGNTYTWTRPDCHYIQWLNNGAPYENMAEGLSVFSSSHSSPNHVFGMGGKISLAYFGGRSDVEDGSAGIRFIVETKLGNAIHYMEGPFDTEMEMKQKPLFDWEYGDQFVTSVMVEVPDETWNALDFEDMYDFLCWKFGMKLYKTPNLTIKYGNNGKKVRSYLPGKMPEELSIRETNLAEEKRTVIHRSIPYSDDRVSGLFSYEFYHWNKVKKEFTNRNYQGVTVFCDWIAIAHLGTGKVIAKKVDINSGKEWVKESGYREHDTRNGLVSFVNIMPNAEKSVIVPFNNDKSDFNFNKIEGQKCRAEIDEVCVGDFYRNFINKKSEAASEELLYEISVKMSKMFRIKNICPIRQVAISKDITKKIDIAFIGITPENESKVNEYLQKRKNGKKATYKFSKEDFIHPDSFLSIMEMKQMSKPLTQATIDQAVNLYGRNIQSEYGYDYKKIVYGFMSNGNYDTKAVKDQIKDYCDMGIDIIEFPKIAMYED